MGISDALTIYCIWSGYRMYLNEAMQSWTWWGFGLKIESSLKGGGVNLGDKENYQYSVRWQQT